MCAEKQKVIGSVSQIQHLERANVLYSRSAQLVTIDVMNHSSPAVRIGNRQHLSPPVCSKQPIVSIYMIRMAQETIDFLIHKSHKNFASWVLHYPPHRPEGRMRKSERVDKHQTRS